MQGHASPCKFMQAHASPRKPIQTSVVGQAAEEDQTVALVLASGIEGGAATASGYAEPAATTLVAIWFN
eukprot:3949392-Lingulodinium_polyedra.AAC.1